MRYSTIMIVVLAVSFACGDDADDAGIAAECKKTEDCEEGLTCLTNFKGGYCGMSGCARNADCPDLSICVTHDDNNNYCFRTCVDKEKDCNANRTKENEANCESSITRVDGGSEKACVPPSSGT